MMTHIIDQFILNPSSFFLIPGHFDQFISDPKSKQGESRKIMEIWAKLFEFCYKLNMWHTLLMVVIICGKYGNNRSRTENVTERTRFSKSSSYDLATHPFMLMIICTKYGKNPSRTVDATERTRFSRSRPNHLENIGQGQRSLHATHPLMLMMICAKNGKNTSRIVDIFFQGESWKSRKISEKLKF